MVDDNYNSLKSLEEIAKVQILGGAAVWVLGKGFLKTINIGLGVAHLLASIPEKGAKVDELDVSPIEFVNSWIRDLLIPLGLVEERESERFYRTSFANSAQYLVKPILLSKSQAYCQD